MSDEVAYGGLASLGARLREVPLGVLVLASLCGMVGAGLAVGGVVLLLEGERLTPWAGAIGLAAAPAALYLGYGLLIRARWAWLAVVTLTLLLVASSIGRLLVSPGVPVVAMGEIAVELLVLRYLTRPRVRDAFSRGRPPPPPA